MKEVDRVRQAILGEVNAEKNRDVEADMSYIHRDFRYVAPESPIIGKDEYRGGVVEFLKTFESIDSFDILRTEVSDSGDLAYAVGTVTWTYKGPQGLKTESCKWHRTLKKEDGEWKILVLSWCI